MAFNYRPMTPTSYVTFVKATETLWDKMEASQRLDNVLYFVVDGPDDTVGKLYLGNTLIADGNGITDIGISNLNDVKIKLEGIHDGDVLMYNMIKGKWENVSLAETLGDLISLFNGATAEAAGTSGLVPAPSAGDQDNYLKGDGTWANPVAAVTVDLDNLKTRVDTLIGSDEKMSARTIAINEASKAASAAVSQIVANAPTSFDTLKDIADWIQDHPSTETFVTLSNKVTSLDETVNGVKQEDGTIVGGLVPQVKSLATTVDTLSAKVTTLEGNTLLIQKNISDLQKDLSTLNTTVSDHATRITSLEERLVWQELVETA